jgi:hypothetical protein
MKKWIFIGLAVFVLVVAVFLYLGLSNLGPIIKKAVNTYGPKITKTDVRVADVGVSILSLQAEIRDFLLGNPPGYKQPNAITVGSVMLDVDEKSLTGETIVIDRIAVENPEISYEKQGRKDNIKDILNNVKQATGGAKSASEASGSDTGSGKKMIIRDFTLTDAKLNLVAGIPKLAEKEVSAKLPDIHLTDIGAKEGGATAGEAFEQIFAALYARITSPEVMSSLTDQLKNFGVDTSDIQALTGGAVGKAGEVTKSLDEKTGGALEKAGEKVKGILGN